MKKRYAALAVLLVVGFIGLKFSLTTMVEYAYTAEWVRPLGERLDLYHRPIEKYLNFAEELATRCFIVSTIFLAGYLAVTSPQFRAWIDRRYPRVEPPPARSGKPYRFIWAQIAIGVILVGHVVDMFIGREHWPFSHYPMYTGLQSQTYQLVMTYGVKEDGSEIELTRYFVPLSKGRVSNIVANYGKRSPAEHARVCAEMYLSWYEKSRQLGRHQGPPIKALRLYQVDYLMDTEAEDYIANLQKTLLAEAMRS